MGPIYNVDVPRRTGRVIGKCDGPGRVWPTILQKRIVLPGPGWDKPVAPVAYQVILEPGIGQFREFEPRRVHTRINSLGLFLVHILTCGKRENK